VSLNDVGGEPDRFGITPGALHEWMVERARRWPHGLSTTSTHDTKRSEDIRARLNVLSELPGAWRQAASRWARANRRGRSTIDGQSYPSRNEEYLLYQTLVGTWPLDAMNEAEERVYRERIVAYMHKAMREAKVFTSWLNPSDDHETAMRKFVQATLAPGNTAFLDDFRGFARRIARYGVYNSLAQVAIKIGAPGVPDFYQGTELWDFSLVDPDNRRPVDYERRRALLAGLERERETGGRAALVSRLMEAPHEDRLKLYATATMLRFRRQERGIFEQGGYVPLAATGSRSDHVFAFARERDGRRVLVVVPRLVATLAGEDNVPPIGEAVWHDTRLEIPDAPTGAYRDIFTDICLQVRRDAGTPGLPIADALRHFPIAVLAPG